MIFSKEYLVNEKDTAKEMGSGDLEVLATPKVVAMVENTAKDYLNNKLSEYETSVGIAIELNHLKPSMVGAVIQVKLLEISQNKNKTYFQFEVYENQCLIAKGTHTRATVITQDFLTNLEKK
ncbi:hypothetical protein QQG09_01635 [Melissococcus plutonius]|uniref:Fluoroacetyl-CoA-specific thioesterase-like domain-containing protein n=1 Tax=Melissococcus plutonius TaxID=33970 RepID=A0A2Z5Y2G3_9ENTE|nr:hypothetical protein [Melissococcus plutonius]BAL62118.1 hypothetical protein MPD5_0879 [Melissococcus plutonius DAT561]MCV2497884.1 hypothetical protein [Melissococcus plutonius]MCV2500509.1 hypothetical protein [Melissococcus plutonius]MCV2505223.1 hypothetical protein [Melissococcus plutonius]MCV2506499.1 hypothetical protein [Melissococcus plutonius]